MNQPAHANEAAKQTLQGWVPNASDPKELFEALDKAFDYRGDVTLTLRDGRRVEGYIYDRRRGTGLDDSLVRVMPANEDTKVSYRYADITRIEFTGKDTAHGKTWENWVKRYVDKKLKGEKAEIEAENLDEK